MPQTRLRFVLVRPWSACEHYVYVFTSCAQRVYVKQTQLEVAKTTLQEIIRSGEEVVEVRF